MYLYFGVSKLFQAVINLVVLGKTVDVIGLLLKYKINERIVDRNPQYGTIQTVCFFTFCLSKHKEMLLILQ